MGDTDAYMQPIENEAAAAACMRSIAPPSDGKKSWTLPAYTH